ncbi:DUF5990 family protein [Streptomyces sp. NPDC054837]
MAALKDLIAWNISDPHRPQYYQLRAGSLSRATARKGQSGVFAPQSLSPPPSAIPGPGKCRIMATMHIRIDTADLPGPACTAPANVPAYDNIHVAVQRRDRPAELLEPQPGERAIRDVNPGVQHAPRRPASRSRGLMSSQHDHERARLRRRQQIRLLARETKAS